jgi:predicted RNA-binding protein
VSHLFFADDSIIFCKAKKEEAIQLIAIFDEYQRISGQQINMAKSEMTFSPNIQQASRKILRGFSPSTSPIPFSDILECLLK